MSNIKFLDEHGLAHVWNKTKEIVKAIGDKFPVTTENIVDSAITTEKIAQFAITKDKLGAGSVTPQKIENSAVKTDAIADNAITESKITDGAVTESKILAGAVSTSRIADSAVSSVKIANSAVITDKIADKAVTESKISSDIKTLLDVSVKYDRAQSLTESQKQQVRSNIGLGAIDPKDLGTSAYVITYNTAGATTSKIIQNFLNDPHRTQLYIETSSGSLIPAVVKYDKVVGLMSS